MCGRAVRVAVELHLRAVTCPGVYLPDKDDLYVSVCLMGQYKTSECVSPVFPLVFQEKMRFEKIFKHVSDPAEVAQLLEDETVKIELIQLIPPGGESLAHVEQDVRQFLFPEPRLVPPSPGIDREALMTRAATFPGIAPRVEFSTRTSIRECPLTAEKRVFPNILLSSGARRSTGKKIRVPGSQPPSAARRRPSCPPGGYGKRQLDPPRCRSLPPYSSSRHPPHSLTGLDFRHDDLASSEGEDDFLNRHVGCSQPPPSPSVPGRNSFRPGPPHVWDQVHERVRRLLTTSRAMRRLESPQGSVESDAGDVVVRRSITPQP